MIKKELNVNLTSEEFLSYYYLKEELIEFCKKNSLDTKGNKEELNNRIIAFLDTGIKLTSEVKNKKHTQCDNLTLDSLIEENISFSEDKRAFFKEHIGPAFSFNVIFQKWLKQNAGKTYQEAILAYLELKKDKSPKPIDRQFEYNTYIRDFFNDNNDRSLSDAIKCWKYKKSIIGTNKYEREDLKALESDCLMYIK